MAPPTISEIISVIGDLLTEEQQGQLVTTLLDGRIRQVNPGDLITAGLVNQMLGDITDLAVRVAALEGAKGGPVVTGIAPDNTGIEIGSLLTVMGTGFNREPAFNIVHLGGKTITQFHEGSSEVALIFPVPDLFSGLPKKVDVSVETGGKVSNTYPVNLVAKPREQLGHIDIDEAAMPSGVLAADANVTFGWDVTAATTLDDTLTFTLEVAGAQPPATAAQWQASAANGFSPPSQMPIKAGETKRVNLTVHAPVGATAANLQFKAVGIDGQVEKLSPVIEWRAGQSLAVSSPNAEITIDEVGDTNFTIVPNFKASNGTTYPQGFTAKVGAPCDVAFQIKDKRGSGPSANYTCTATFASDQGDWAIAPIMGGSTTGLAPGGDITFAATFDNNAGAAGKEYFLKIEASQTKSVSGIVPYSSFTIYPIKLIA